MPRVSIPPPYQGPTQGKGEVTVAGRTILECLDAVEARYPGFRAQVVGPDGRAHKFVTLFVNGAQVASAGLDTTIGEDDEVAILAAIAGG